VKASERAAYEAEIGRRIFYFDFEKKLTIDAPEAEVYVVAS
jgi:hypothetical protein